MDSHTILKQKDIGFIRKKRDRDDEPPVQSIYGTKDDVYNKLKYDEGYWNKIRNENIKDIIVKDKKLTYTQKHNQFVDFLKDKWCEKKCIPLVRIWEFDVKNNPQEVFNQLSPYITEANRKKLIADRKKLPH